MKIAKIGLFLVLLLGVTFQVEAQTKRGSTATPYSTEGWDAPIDSAKYYKVLKIFRLLSNPGGWHNLNMVAIDSLFNELVVFTDTTQLMIENDTLRHSSYASGHNAFSGTAQTDTIPITGLDSSDVFIVSVREDIPGANDRLSIKLIDNKAIIQRPASGTSGLRYNWIWRRRY